MKNYKLMGMMTSCGILDFVPTEMTLNNVYKRSESGAYFDDFNNIGNDARLCWEKVEEPTLPQVMAKLACRDVKIVELKERIRELEQCMQKLVNSF
jgi:hypothetical protein